MKSSTVLILVANVVATVLGALVAANTYPSLNGVFGTAAGLLVGWVNAQKPGTAAKIEAAKNS